ncbi:exported hypothetical protein [Cupriavidus taiwanensis]|uniref:Probable membrane transporter protein n=1 Tax=Cupriavidus taiwanensis TaxID=164546 RepID=A0A375J938_9BURK|nr:exported hypothetical protein [Cupriavidus taiwanensis]
MPDHLLLSSLLICGLGGLLGAVGGLFGIGGGLIAIPALGLLFGMDQQLAQGTALVMIAPNVLIGFWQYRKRADIALRTAVVLACPRCWRPGCRHARPPRWTRSCCGASSRCS